jgi:DNA (cytosine-5)-methyltransferase 1
MLTHFSLFTGIGGLDLAAEWAGFTTVGQCEWADYPTKVLEKHWPDVPRWRDIRSVTKESFTEQTGLSTVDIISGGFPCQDISVAGRQDGIEGERSGLWGEMCRVISEIRPKYALMENVANLLVGEHGTWFGRVLGDLAEVGYDAEWNLIPAAIIGAPHIRERIWILAYPAGIGRIVLQNKETYDSARKCLPDNFKPGYRWKRETGRHSMERVGWTVEPGICGSSYDVPYQMDRLKCLGNAVVPQQAYPIFQAIADIENGISLTSRR